MLLRYQEQLYEHCGANGTQLVAEWCLLIDNSGSMASKANEAKMAVALMMEVLRRLESKFAVVTFGRKQAVRVGAAREPTGRLLHDRRPAGCAQLHAMRLRTSCMCL